MKSTNLLVNPYFPEMPLKNFPKLDDDILKYYDRLYHTTLDYGISTRYFYEMGLKIGFRDIFYYIDQLYNNQPTSIIDVGCGECTWKQWFPNIIGFDVFTNEFSKQDFTDAFDQDFSTRHSQYYDCGMALNSLHFIDWKDIPTRINLAMNIVKDQFLFTFNFSAMQNTSEYTSIELVSILNDMLKQLNYEIKLFDCPVLRGVSELSMSNWSHLNGYVRFILAHKH